MVYPRILDLPSEHRFFQFGPRGTGKSTLVEHWMNELARRSRVDILVASYSSNG
jgi:putative protein kinase ArgK-like GTPase of G3E family